MEPLLLSTLVKIIIFKTWSDKEPIKAWVGRFVGRTKS